MVKKVAKEIAEELGLDEEELEEEDLELLEQERKRPGASPPKNIPKKPEKEVIKERYMVFSQPPRVGIVDRETEEVLAEGDALVPQALANIIERLERIESNIGNLLPE